MSEAKAKQPGKISTFIKWAFSIIATLFISLVISIVIEILGITFDWWQQPGHLHAKHMFTSEINWVLGDFLSTNNWYQNKFVSFFKYLYEILIINTGLEFLLKKTNFVGEYLLAVVYIIQVVIVRILIILCAIPAFLLINVFVASDGLLYRELRKLGGDREHPFIYHHSKRWIKPLVGLPIVLLLASPFSVHPTIFILVITIVPSVFIWLAFALFMKYL